MDNHVIYFKGGLKNINVTGTSGSNSNYTFAGNLRLLMILKDCTGNHEEVTARMRGPHAIRERRPQPNSVIKYYHE